MRKTIAVLAVAVATAASLLVAAAPASAGKTLGSAQASQSSDDGEVGVLLEGPHYQMKTDDTWDYVPGGQVDFWTDGDIVRLCDTHADGARAVLYVYDNTAHGKNYRIEASGAGVCKTVRASEGAPYDLPENHCFQFYILLTDNGVTVPGSVDEAYWRNYNDATANCG